jgi:hypothetical protein
MVGPNREGAQVTDVIQNNHHHASARRPHLCLKMRIRDDGRHVDVGDLRCFAYHQWAITLYPEQR